jgi:hypothetical protein
MVWGLVPTQLEADEIAVTAARAWIDKHVGDC